LKSAFIEKCYIIEEQLSNISNEDNDNLSQKLTVLKKEASLMSGDYRDVKKKLLTELKELYTITLVTEAWTQYLLSQKTEQSNKSNHFKC
jgi:hypothetical protein